MKYRVWKKKTPDRRVVLELTHSLAAAFADRLESDETLGTGTIWSDEKRAQVRTAQAKTVSLLAGILAARGITAPEEALTLLTGEEELSDPFLLKDMDKACARILRAAENGETVVIFGDYDVDGVTATALLYEHLKGMGMDVKCMLPSRDGDGYGLSCNALRLIHEKGYRLVVTVDNGISAGKEAEYAAELGIDLVITDHHLPPETLPRAVAIVDPRRLDDTSPCKGLCGAGVAFKLCAALEQCDPMEMLDYCADLAALGTIADVMPLSGENRTLVKAGLRSLQQTDRPGLVALLEEVGLYGKTITAENISYGIAPRINAAGRMKNAATALQLLLADNEGRAQQLAQQLAEVNVARQEVEHQIAHAVEAQIAADPTIQEDRIMLVWGQNWHQGVIGIVASRLVERYGRPVIVASLDENGEAKGSGRSVPGINLHACIASCEDLLIRYGGHAMAAGLSVQAENLPLLRRRLNDWVLRECPVVQAPPLECDLAVRLERITVDAVRCIDRLAPFGADNPTPIFLLENATLENIYSISEGKHTRLRLRQGNATVYAVWFAHPFARFPYEVGAVLDVAMNLSVYESSRGAQLSGRVLEVQPAGGCEGLAEQAALVEALRQGSPLSEAQKERIRPRREDIAALYRELRSGQWHAEDLRPLLAKLGTQNSGKTLVALTALEQMGLVERVDHQGAGFLELIPSDGKKNLDEAPILKCFVQMTN